MIDLDNEDLFPLSKGPPGIRPRLSSSTYWRWSQRGVVRQGRRRRLETVVIGGRRYSSVQAYYRFLGALNESDAPEATVSGGARRREKARAAERAADLFPPPDGRAS